MKTASAKGNSNFAGSPLTLPSTQSESASVAVFSPEEHGTRLKAKIALVVDSNGFPLISGHEVIELEWAQSDMFRDREVKAAAEGHGKSSVMGRQAGYVCGSKKIGVRAGISESEESLSEYALFGHREVQLRPKKIRDHIPFRLKCTPGRIHRWRQMEGQSCRGVALKLTLQREVLPEIEAG